MISVAVRVHCDKCGRSVIEENGETHRQNDDVSRLITKAIWRAVRAGAYLRTRASAEGFLEHECACIPCRAHELKQAKGAA